MMGYINRSFYTLDDQNDTSVFSLSALAVTSFMDDPCGKLATSNSFAKKAVSNSTFPEIKRSIT
jgi:hypothetical protein